MTLSVAWIGLGSNLESPGDQLGAALARLDADRRLQRLALSRFYRTTPLGGPPDQPDFCNACAAFATDYLATDLLAVMQAVEREHGRVRDVRWGPRTLDLDMLAFDEQQLGLPELTLPHPRAHERAFVLVPLAEIAPALVLAQRLRVIDWLARADRSGVEPWPTA